MADQRRTRSGTACTRAQSTSSGGLESGYDEKRDGDEGLTKGKAEVTRPYLEALMGALQVEVMRLTECLVSPGWRLIFDEMNAPALHYTLAGTGRLLLDGSPPIELSPHKLVVLPPRTMFSFEAAVEDGDGPSQVMDARPAMRAEKTIHRIVAGSGEPKLVMVCGYFRALYGSSVEIFSFLAEPIVENFDQADQVEARLRATLAEVAFRQVGSDVMTTTLLKQVMIALFRKSLTSSRLWTERLSLLGDPPIARAFAEMTARPGAAHDVGTLAYVAGLSRSAFVNRFEGCSASLRWRPSGTFN